MHVSLRGVKGSVATPPPNTVAATADARAYWAENLDTRHPCSKEGLAEYDVAINERWAEYEGSSGRRQTSTGTEDDQSAASEMFRCG